MPTDPAALIAEARKWHAQDQVTVNGPLEDWCAKCGESWPCSVIGLADALEEAWKDSERIEWLDENALPAIEWIDDDERSLLIKWAHATNNRVPTLRAAIDAARGGRDG